MVTFSFTQWFCFLTNLQVVAFASPIPCLLLLLFAVPLIWKKRRYAIQTNIMLSRTKLSHIAQGMWMWFANKEEKVWFELLGAHSWCHAALSHILLTRLGIYDISRNLAVLVLAVAGQHTHMTDPTVDNAWSWWKGNVERPACHSRRTSFFPRQLIVTAPQSQRHT